MSDTGKWAATQEQQKQHGEAQELVAKELMGGCIESAVETADFSTTESGNWHNWLREEIVKALRERDNEIKRLRSDLDKAYIEVANRAHYEAEYNKEIEQHQIWLSEMAEDFRLDADAHDLSRRRAIAEALRNARAEIERLRSERDVPLDRVAYEEGRAQGRKEADAEIERLRKELETARSIVRLRWMEIERLRAERERILSDYADLCEVGALAKANAEIERLRTNYDLLGDDYKQLLEDNERLRNLEADALVIANTTAANLHEEINRLRNLLQQAIRAQWPPPPEWYEAAREAISTTHPSQCP